MLRLEKLLGLGPISAMGRGMRQLAQLAPDIDPARLDLLRVLRQPTRSAQAREEEREHRIHTPEGPSRGL
jgi:hypothetical protein